MKQNKKDGVDKKWSKKFSECIKCTTKNKRHKGHGLCITCYENKRYNEKFKDDKEFLKLKRERAKKNYDSKKKQKQRIKYKNTHRERYLKQQRKDGRKKAMKLKVGMLLKNEILKNPTKQNKSLWDGIGSWSKSYDYCIECNQDLYKHHGNGICKLCYDRLRYSAQDEEKRRKKIEYLREYHKNNRDKEREYRKTRKSEAHKFINEAKNKEYSDDPRIQQLLSKINE